MRTPAEEREVEGGRAACNGGWESALASAGRVWSIGEKREMDCASCVASAAERKATKASSAACRTCIIAKKRMKVSGKGIRLFIKELEKEGRKERSRGQDRK